MTARSAARGKLPQQIPTLTDGAGNFFLGGLEEGTYRLSAIKNGHTPDSTEVEPVKLGPSRDAVALRLQPLGKITGKVTDSDGDPVPNVSVRALHAILQDGRRSFRQDRSVATDDRGQYRLWNLAPGEYYIVAAGRSGGTLTYVGPISSGGVHEGFAPAYYPAAHDRASAMPINLTPGQEFTADLKIAMQPAFRVRGTLRNVSVRQPVRVELQREAGEAGANRVLVNAATGRFEANDVVPGTYLLRASQGRGVTEIRGEQQVQVARSDVDGLVVELLPGVNVTGVVRGAPMVNDRGRTSIPGCDVSLASAGKDSDPIATLPARSDEDGRFSIGGVHPGHYRVQVQPSMGYVASLVSGTHDLRNGAELVIGLGTPPEPIEVVLRDDGGSIAGTIDDSVKVKNGAWVLLAPLEGGEPERSVAYEGKFESQRLAPGDYRVYLFQDLENIEYRNPEFLRGLKGGETVRVTAGGTTTVTLKAVAQ